MAADRERILFVCTAAERRSKAAEDLYREDERYEVKSAGVAKWAKKPLTLDLLLWADRMFVMEEGAHRLQIKHDFPWAPVPRIEVLDIEDKWPHAHHPELVDLLKRRLKRYLGLPRPEPKAP